MKLTKEQIIKIDTTLISINEILSILDEDSTSSDAELLESLNVKHETIMFIVDKLTELNK